MRTLLALALLASAAVAGGARAQDGPDGQGVLVRFASDADSGERAAARQEAGADFEAKLPLPGLQVVEPQPGLSAGEVAARLERSDDVLYAEPDVSREASLLPDDALADQLWGLQNTGQSVDGVAGTVDADIDATEAWDLTTGDSRVTVGIVDTGVDYTHSDLAPNIWRNPGESGAGRETNRVDDDGNGYVDDWRGWDWVGRDNAPADELWHGTHVAGTIGARGNDGSGVAGVAWKLALVSLRVLDGSGAGQVSSLVSAYGYARQAGLKIVNASLGGSYYSRAEHDALEAASGTLFVVAAGNGGPDRIGDDNDTGAAPTYPCAYDLPNVICVAATDNRDRLASFSNYGSRSVDLAAPGVGIASTIPSEHWGILSGTSMATPYVSGAAALRWARFPAATVAQVRSALLTSVEAKPSLAGKVATGGRLNVNRALGGPPLPNAPLTLAPIATLDTRAPSVVVVPRGRLNVRRGVRVRTRCSEACGVRHELVVGARAARRLGIRRGSTRILGRTGAQLRRAVTVTLRLKLKASARRRLNRTHRLRLELRTRAVDRSGNVRVVRRSIYLFAR